MPFLKNHSKLILYTFFSIALYYVFAYQLVRENFYLFSILYLTLFVLFGLFLQQSKKEFSILIVLAILFRFLFLLAIPNLSQDFYRFIWDGRMILEGFNPYLSTPESWINSGQNPINQAKELYAGMGNLNGSHYTNYPPLNQLCFYIAALFSSKSILGSVIVMRLLMILSDIGIIYFGSKLLKLLNLPKSNILLYALNPFIIIELTGNLHFEAVMLFFAVWSLYLLVKQKWIGAAILIGLSVSVKLIPLIFLPLFFQWFIKNKWRGFFQYVLFCFIVVITVIVTFLPFLTSEFIENYKSTVGLWFNKFEFNASLYYIARAIGYTKRGFNEIAVIGQIMPMIAVSFLLIITFFRKNKQPIELISALLLGLTFYYFTTTTMHPWYISTLLILSVFTKYRFTIVWSITILLSYQAYANTPWKENLWFIGIEYLFVYGYLIWELFNLNRYQHRIIKDFQ